MNLVKALAIVAALAALGIGIGWYGSRPGPQPAPTTQPAGQPAKEAPVLSPKTVPLTSRPTKPVTPVNPAPVLPAEPPAPTVAQTNLITDWEDRLDEVLGSEAAEAQKANALLEMFSRLPEAGQVDVALHLSNLVEDENYAGLGQHLTNSTLSEDVLDVLLSDLLNRPNTIKLPMLIGVAQDPRNPKSGEAKDLLELYLEEDYGTDWATWQTKVGEWLKENPD